MAVASVPGAEGQKCVCLWVCGYSPEITVLVQECLAFRHTLIPRSTACTKESPHSHLLPMVLISLFQ